MYTDLAGGHCILKFTDDIAKRIEAERDKTSCAQLSDMLSQVEKDAGVIGVWNIELVGTVTLEATSFEEYLVRRFFETWAEDIWQCRHANPDKPLPQLLSEYLRTVFTEKGRNL
jgi:hypothetical protein